MCFRSFFIKCFWKADLISLCSVKYDESLHLYSVEAAGGVVYCVALFQWIFFIFGRICLRTTIFNFSGYSCFECQRINYFPSNFWNTILRGRLYNFVRQSRWCDNAFIRDKWSCNKKMITIWRGFVAGKSFLKVSLIKANNLIASNSDNT